MKAKPTRHYYDLRRPFESATYKLDLEMWSWLEKLKVEHDLLKKHSGRWLHFVAVDYPEIKESLSPQKLMELKEKAEKWDEALIINVKIGNGKPISCVDMAKKLEAVKKAVVTWHYHLPAPFHKRINEILGAEG